MSVEEKAWKPKNMEVTIQATEDRPMSDKEHKACFLCQPHVGIDQARGYKSTKV